MWMDLDKAVVVTKTSQSTWYRRLREGHPARLLKGTRQVWVTEDPDNAALTATVEQLVAKVDQLVAVVAQLADAPRREQLVSDLDQEVPQLVDATRPEQLVSDSDRDVLVPVVTAPRPRSAAPDIDNIIARIEAEWTESETSLLALVGRASSFLAQARRGQKRSGRTWRVWRQLEDILDGQGRDRHVA